ncbi:MAG TPA: TonB-dependent receptor [Acidobacteriota bacterium]|nr:TonB-dependent receptor [Acidobacteriota bacterium]
MDAKGKIIVLPILALISCLIALPFLHVLYGAPVESKDAAELRGTVTLERSGRPVSSASVTIVQLDRSVMTDSDGVFVFSNIPPGSYSLISHMHTLTSTLTKVEIPAGGRISVELILSISPIRQEITVTSTGWEQTTFDALHSVGTVDTFRLSERSAFSLGEILDNEYSVHKRGFGPGSSRPVIRGFDGDRVLILSDGLPTGTLSSQSGEHPEPVDAANLYRIETVKGPAALLYGSNAIGGVVNMISGHHMLHRHPHPGFRGQITTIGGTNNNQAAVHVDSEYGFGNWLFWNGGARQVAGDYSSPAGRVDNSETRMTSGNTGFGRFTDNGFFTIGYGFNKGRLGIPMAGELHHDHDQDHDNGAAFIDETFTWQNTRFTAGMQHLNSFIEEFKVAAGFSRWMHKELDDHQTHKSFDNKLANLRVTFNQREHKSLTGSSGFQFFHRDYTAEGKDALSPPVTGNGLAFFTLQEIDLSKARLQFGGRLDRTAYAPSGLAKRTFTGFSGAAGIHVPLWRRAAFVANYTHSFRAPAIEELYNYGPHIGNLAFEIGDPGLKREVSDGMDFSLRHDDAHFDIRADFFYYHIRDFVYLNMTGEWDHGLRVAEFSQADARFIGGEARFNVAVHRNLWLNSGFDIVDARLTASGKYLPRIPPLRGKLGFEARWGGLNVRPEIVMASSQTNVSSAETATSGYTLINATGSYTFAQADFIHTFSVTLFNAGNRLYRNHLSFIKDYAPEIGRGVRFNYSLRFF